MSYNRKGEYQLAHIKTGAGDFYISRASDGKHVLREGSPDGKELFANKRDDEGGIVGCEKQRDCNDILRCAYPLQGVSGDHAG